MRRLIGAGIVVLVAALLSSVSLAQAQGSFNGLALTPPMGWNSWNAYQCTEVAGTIEAAAAAIHGSPVPGSAPAPGSLQSQGYDYVNNDGCWNDLVGEGSPDPTGSTAYIPGRNPPSAPAEACGVVNGRLPGPGGPGTGSIFVNPYEFPPSSTPSSVGYWTPSQSNACLNDGIEVVANYVHSLGLKFGLWADDGNNWNCEEIPGSYGFDSEDAQTFASWGVDYIKGDWGCGATSTDPFTGQVGLGPAFNVSDPGSAETMYHALSDALLATGRPIVFAADGAGITPASDPWLISDGPSFVNQIRPVSSSNSFSNLVSIINTDDQVASQLDHPGFWVDPDIMEVGNGALGTVGDQSEMSLFSILSMPLLTSTQLGSGANCTSFDTAADYAGPTLPSIPFYTPPASIAGGTTPAGGSFTAPAGTGSPGTGVPCHLSSYLASVFGNSDLVALDQDSLGTAAHVVSFDGTHLVLAKTLANGDTAVALFNEGSAPATISTTASALGMVAAPAYSVRDLWSKSTTETRSVISAYVAPHATAIYRVFTDHKWNSGAPQVSLAPSADSSQVTPGSPVNVTVTVTDDGAVAANQLQVGLDVPSGWQAQEVTPPAPGALAPGSSTTAVWQVTPAAATAPISSASLTATASYHYSGGTVTTSSALPLTVASPVQSPLQTANLSGGPAVFAQLGQAFAIQAGGSVSTTADQYGVIYQHAVVGPANTVQATVTRQPGASRGAKAGIVIRNDATGGGPEGVLLYVSAGSSSSTVQMAWNAGSGADITKTSASSPVVSDPVTLRLVRSGTNGSTYTGYYSTNGGSTWTQLGAPVNLSSSAAQAATQDAGMFQASGSTTPAEADFSGFTVS